MSSVKAQQFLLRVADIYLSVPQPMPRADLLKKVNEIKYLAAQKKAVEEAAQVVLDVREEHKSATLADLYNPNTMPKVLLDAHHTLDRVVDACYGTKKFPTESARLEFLFNLYAEHLLKINERQIK